MSEKLSKGRIWSLVLTSIFIVAITITNFVFSENKFVITGSIITLICLLLIVVLSNSFDNFSVGQLITINREVKENKQRVEKLEKEKNELIFQLINLNFQSQTASNKTGIYIGNNGLNSDFSVQKADPSEKNDDEENYDQKDSCDTQKIIDEERFETLILQKHFGVNKMSELTRDIKVVDKFQDIDSISNKSTLFSAYLRNNDEELFIDVKTKYRYGINLTAHNRIYLKANKVLSYRNSKNAKAKLLYIVAKPDYEEDLKESKLSDWFFPALKNDLLEIVYVPYSKTEYESCLIEE